MQHLKFLIITILLSIPSIVLSQNIEFGEKQYYKVGVDKVYPVGENSFFALTHDDMLGLKPKLKYYENNNAEPVVQMIEIPSKEYLVSYNIIKNDLWITFAKYIDEEIEISLQQIDKNCLPVGERKKLVSFPSNGSKKLNQYSIKFLTSPDQKTFCIYASYNNTKEEKHFIGYKSFNADFETVNEAQKLITRPTSSSWHAQPVSLTNFGNLFIQNVVFDWDGKDYKIKTKIFYCAENQLREWSHDKNELYKFEETAPGEVICIGTATEDKVSHIFYSPVDIETGALTNVVSNKLENPLTYMVCFTEFHILPNGDFLIFFEQNSWETYINRNTQPYTQYQVYFNRNTTALRMSNKGNLLWCSDLGHSYVTEYTNKDYKKYVGFLTDTYEMYINGDITDPKGISTWEKVPKDKNNRLFNISIDLETGSFERKQVQADANDGGLYLYTESSSQNINSRNLVMCFAVNSGNFNSLFGHLKY